MKVLITGGTGYIGSHAAVELLKAGNDVVLFDNFSTSTSQVAAAIGAIADRETPLIVGDVRDLGALNAAFETYAFDAVLHLAGAKAVGESVAFPLAYYDNNVCGTVRLLECMAAHDVKTLVFSSSATVYGVPERMPIGEDSRLAPTNPYGRSKLIVENMLKDLHRADGCWRISILRYFNPVGGHASGQLGEDPCGVSSNLMPCIGQVALGRQPHLAIFGDDYPTLDGTCIRDYIHVVDLAKGHLQALAFLAAGPKLAIHNLGTGVGYSVREVVRAFETASGRPIPCKVVGRRLGDIAECYADPSRAWEELGWKAAFGLEQMCQDAWHSLCVQNFGGASASHKFGRPPTAKT